MNRAIGTTRGMMVNDPAALAGPFAECPTDTPEQEWDRNPRLREEWRGNREAFIAYAMAEIRVGNAWARCGPFWGPTLWTT